MNDPLMLNIQYWSCGCITHSLPVHEEHPIAFLIGWERRYVENVIPTITIVVKDPNE